MLYEVMKVKGMLKLKNLRIYPSGLVFSWFKTDKDLIIEAYQITCHIVTRFMILSSIFCLFCVHALFSSSDKDFLITSSLSLPFRLGEISFQSFLLLGPVILMFLRIYVQTYYEHSLLLEKIMERRGITKPAVLNYQNHFFLCWIKEFNLYFLIPLVMFCFIIKSAVLPHWAVSLSAVTTVIILIHLWFMKKDYGKYLSLPKVILIGGILSCLSVGFYFVDRIIDGVIRPMNLEQADLSNLNLTERFMVKANLQEANLKNAKLWRTNLKEAKLQYANLSRAQLWRANLSHANLQGVKLSDAFLRQANLSYSSMNLSNLHRSNLIDADLTGADLRRAFLRGANLRGANLRGANLHEANLRGAKLHGANLLSCQGLTQRMIEKAHGDHLTKLPSYLKKPIFWRRFIEEEEEPLNG